MIAACIFASALAGGGAPPYGAPTANFIPSNPEVPIYSTVYFYDTSAGIPTSWEWHYGLVDGPIFAITQFPSYFFTSPGSYPITLVATNSYGSSTYTDYIQVFN